MLYFGYEFNMLPEKTWKYLGKPQLVYFPIHLRTERQYYIFLVGRLENVEIDVAGVKNKTNFDVIEIM
jgi:hypothetical protein